MPYVQDSKYRYPVYPVNSCPKTEEEWKTSAEYLNCSHDQTLKQRYLCIPNQEKTALLQFCYDLVRPRIVEGFCVELAGSGTLNHESCTHFPAGCPNVSYFSDEIFKYPQCLDVDTEHNCFKVEPSCQNRSSHTTTPRIQLNNSSTFLNTTSSPGDSSNNYTVISIAVALGICLPLLILILAIACYKLQRNKRNEEQEEQVPLIGKYGGSNIDWVTPLTGDLESGTEDVLTYLFCMLMKNQPLKYTDIDSKEWKTHLDLIRNHLQLESVPIKTKEDIVSELRKEKVKKFIIIDIPADTMCFASTDAESEVFRTFFKSAEKKHVEIHNSLKFCIENFSNDVIKKYCRSNTYEKSAEERCVLLSRKLTEEMICKLMDDIFNSPTINDPKIHDFVSTKLNIPGEILEGGEQRIRRYIDYLKKGKERIFHARGMIVGCAGAGKTTLLNRLQNKGLKKVKKDTKTTIGVDVHRDVFALEENELTGFSISRVLNS